VCETRPELCFNEEMLTVTISVDVTLYEDAEVVITAEPAVPATANSQQPTGCVSTAVS
jgi:hypothetical protein